MRIGSTTPFVELRRTTRGTCKRVAVEISYERPKRRARLDRYAELRHVLARRLARVELQQPPAIELEEEPDKVRLHCGRESACSGQAIGLA